MSDNADKIWLYLMGAIGNEKGAAAVMGNLMAESSLSPICVTGLSKTGYQSINQYRVASDDGTHDFANDGVAFGIAQWCYHTRKQALLDSAKAANKSVGDLDLQLSHLIADLKTNYKTVWIALVNAIDIRTVSDTFMLKYEKPANTGEAAKQKRANYAEKFYNQYASVCGGMVEIIENNVNLRYGNDMHYAICARANKGYWFPWVATAKNGWHAIEYRERPQRVLWVHPNFSRLKG